MNPNTTPMTTTQTTPPAQEAPEASPAPSTSLHSFSPKIREGRHEPYEPRWENAFSVLAMMKAQELIVSFGAKHYRRVRTEVDYGRIAKTDPTFHHVDRTIMGEGRSPDKQTHGPVKKSLHPKGGRTIAWLATPDGCTYVATSRCNNRDVFIRKEGGLRAVDRLFDDLAKVRPVLMGMFYDQFPAASPENGGKEYVLKFPMSPADPFVNPL